MNTTVSQEFEAIGTHWKIEFTFDPKETDPATIFTAIRKRIDQYDKDYSRFREDSLVTKISHTSGTYEMPEDSAPMFTLYEHLYRLTDGAFTPLIGKMLSEAGYDAKYSLAPKILHKLPPLEDVLKYDAPFLQVFTPVLLDFGAAGKGYLVDIVSEILSENCASTYLVDAGGDMRFHSDEETALRIGLEHPEEHDLAIGVATIHNKSICGSAGSRRSWKGFNHIIDPRTLKSPSDIRAVWVVADTAMTADAMTTCLYFASAERLLNEFDFEYLILRDDYSIEKSEDFPAELFVPQESHI